MILHALIFRPVNAFHEGWHRLQFLIHLLNGRSGKAVHQVDTDMLDMFLAFEVRQEATIPADGIAGPSS